MSDLPSRATVDGYSSVDFEEQQAVLDAYVSGRLVDRETIDREGARATAADVLHVDVSTPEIALILAAALGEEV